MVQIVLVVLGQKVVITTSNAFDVVFLPNSFPHAKFHPNWTKNIKVKKIRYKLVLVVGPVSKK